MISRIGTSNKYQVRIKWNSRELRENKNRFLFGYIVIQILYNNVEKLLLGSYQTIQTNYIGIPTKDLNDTISKCNKISLFLTL